MAAQAAKSVRADPARPLQSLPLVGVLAPPPASRFTLQERQVLLFDGIATFYVNPDGTVRIDREATTYQLNAWNQADPSYLDATTLFQLMRYIRKRRQRLTQKFGRHKLGNNGTSFGAGQFIVTENIARAEMVAMYSEDIADGQVENMEAYKQHLLVQRNPDDPNRLDILDTPDFVNQLRIIASRVEFRLQFTI